jgi:hypothetical protein
LQSDEIKMGIHLVFLCLLLGHVPYELWARS